MMANINQYNRESTVLQPISVCEKVHLFEGASRRGVRRWGCLSDHAQHDRADKGECDIGRNNAQSADDSHGNAPWLTPLPNVTTKIANGSAIKKSALLSIALFPQREPWLKLRKINMLKSP
jgi:hypothetical protein